MVVYFLCAATAHIKARLLGQAFWGNCLGMYLAALLFEVGAGAMAQVAIMLLPFLKDDAGRTATPLTAGGITLGLGFLFATSLFVTVYRHRLKARAVCRLIAAHRAADLEGSVCGGLWYSAGAQPPVPSHSWTPTEP